MAAPSDSSRVLLIGALIVLVAVLGYGAVSFWSTPIEVDLDQPRPQAPRATPVRNAVARHEPVRPRAPEEDRERRPDLSNLPPAREARTEPEPEKEVVAENERPPEVAVAPATKTEEGADGSPSRGVSSADYSKPALDAALAELGVDATKYVDLETRYQQLEADEVKLREDAANEGWLNSLNFAEEMGAVEADRQALRAEIGDEAYDYFLFSMGRTNRVLVSNVEQHSPADVAGLQSGDVIIRYRGARIFTAVDLLAALGSTTPGETVPVEITRQGKPLRLVVGEGGRGIAVEAAQEPPLPPAK